MHVEVKFLPHYVFINSIPYLEAKNKLIKKTGAVSASKGSNSETKVSYFSSEFSVARCRMSNWFYSDIAASTLSCV